MRVTWFRCLFLFALGVYMAWDSLMYALHGRWVPGFFFRGEWHMRVEPILGFTLIALAWHLWRSRHLDRDES